MSEKPWKACERAVAARLGGRRVPITGRQRGDVPDVQHEVFSVEVARMEAGVPLCNVAQGSVAKRRTLPVWLRGAVDQAVAAQRGVQLPVAILHERGTRHGGDLVVLRLADFEDWCGTVRRDQDVPA